MRSALNETSPDNIALIDDERHFTYGDLAQRIDRLAGGLLAGASDLEEARVAFLIPASVDYVTALHGVWRAGGIAIPLNVASTEPEWEHCLTSAGVKRLLTTEANRGSIEGLCDRLSISLLLVDEVGADSPLTLPDLTPERRAMIVFTSGTTSKPKGAVTTHGNIAAQISTLVDAWAWASEDVIPLFLPLHHVHGIINVLSCALWAGATVHAVPKLDIGQLCRQVADDVFSVFMAVPTIYVKLIDYLEALEDEQARLICEGFANMRLNVSGSAACPVEVFEAWRQLTGQVLLERYGMTEIGMALSNPYVGERRPGYVGQPLPDVVVQLIDEAGAVVTEEEIPGEIRIKSPTVFREYWGNTEATLSSFKDGWFCTGDIAVIEDGYYRIMGRSSVDIIKSGGYKLSALEIENKLLAHPEIAEVAVVGVTDRTWGETVAAVVVLKGNTDMTLASLKTWCEGELSPYKIPKHLKAVDSLPRNAMGKVMKPSLKTLFE
ncbi:MAG: acyl-CoA synthetase [Pseudomonadota bacterium]|nr:acyl-CoA synthetase [Pseudomonadota bacterium]